MSPLTNTTAEDVANRRAQLQLWIRQHHGNKQSRFVEASGINQGELSGLLSGKKPFGEKRARSLERAAGMPERFLDQRAAAVVAAAASAASTAALPPSPGWPFTHTSPTEYRRLSEADRSLIEDFVRLLLARAGAKPRSSRQAEPAMAGT